MQVPTSMSYLHSLYRTPQALHADTLALFLETIGSKLTWAEAYVQLLWAVAQTLTLNVLVEIYLVEFYTML